jgi:hypothetical protein
MLNKKILFIGGLLLTLPLVSCSVKVGGDEEGSWDIVADKQEAYDAFKEVVGDLAKISKVKVTMDYYSGAKDVEEINGTNEYMTQVNEDESVQIWLFVENDTYYTAYLFDDEEKGRYHVGKNDYENDFKHYVKILSRFERINLSNYSASFENKGESKTVDGVYTGQGTIEASFTKDQYNFYSYKAKTDGKKVLEIDYKMSESSGGSSGAFTDYSCKVTFDYDTEFEFNKPDLTDWKLS